MANIIKAAALSYFNDAFPTYHTNDLALNIIGLDATYTYSSSHATIADIGGFAGAPITCVGGLSDRYHSGISAKNDNYAYCEYDGGSTNLTTQFWIMYSDPFPPSGESSYKLLLYFDTDYANNPISVDLATPQVLSWTSSTIYTTSSIIYGPHINPAPAGVYIVGGIQTDVAVTGSGTTWSMNGKFAFLGDATNPKIGYDHLDPVLLGGTVYFSFDGESDVVALETGDPLNSVGHDITDGTYDWELHGSTTGLETIGSVASGQITIEWDEQSDATPASLYPDADTRLNFTGDPPDESTLDMTFTDLDVNIPLKQWSATGTFTIAGEILIAPVFSIESANFYFSAPVITISGYATNASFPLILTSSTMPVGTYTFSMAGILPSGATSFSETLTISLGGENYVTALEASIAYPPEDVIFDSFTSDSPTMLHDVAHFLITVTDSGSAPGPTGIVLLKEGSTILGSDTLDGSGDAEIDTSSLSVGTHTITAFYAQQVSPDGTLWIEHSETISHTVVPVTSPRVLVSLNLTAASESLGTFSATGTINILNVATSVNIVITFDPDTGLNIASLTGLTATPSGDIFTFAPLTNGIHTFTLTGTVTPGTTGAKRIPFSTTSEANSTTGASNYRNVGGGEAVNFSNRVGWVFTDPSTGDTYTWPINPASVQSSPRKKQIGYHPSLLPQGNLNAHQGEDLPILVSASGSILTEEQYNSMKLWYNKRNILIITDEFGRSFNIRITRFSPKRVRKPQYPWFHEYTFEYTVVG